MPPSLPHCCHKRRCHTCRCSCSRSPVLQVVHRSWHLFQCYMVLPLPALQNPSWDLAGVCTQLRDAGDPGGARSGQLQLAEPAWRPGAVKPAHRPVLQPRAGLCISSAHLALAPQIRGVALSATATHHARARTYTCRSSCRSCRSMRHQRGCRWNSTLSRCTKPGSRSGQLRSVGTLGKVAVAWWRRRPSPPLSSTPLPPTTSPPPPRAASTCVSRAACLHPSSRAPPAALHLGQPSSSRGVALG